MRLGEFEAVGIAVGCVAVDMRAAGIGKTHHLGALVKRLAGRVVDGAPEYLHVVVVFHEDYLRVATRYEQAQKRVFRYRVVRLPAYEMRQHMSVQVVDIHYRYPEPERHSFGE